MLRKLLIQLIQLLGQKQEMRCRISDRKKQLMLMAVYGSPPKPTEKPTQIIPGKTLELDIDLLEQDINLDFEENSPYQEDVTSEIHQRPDEAYFQEPPELQNQVDTGKLVQKFFPKQADIDKIWKIMQRKDLKGTHLPVTVKGKKTAGYLISPYFKDLYYYVVQNKLSNTKSAIRKMETLAEKYIKNILLDLVLFKLVTIPKKKQHY